MLREKIGKMIRAFRLCFGLYLLFAFFASVLYFIENGVLDYTFQIVIVTGILLIIILCIGRGLTGRRGALFLDHISNNKNFFIWILLMIISFIFLFITVFYSIIDIIKQKDK